MPLKLNLKPDERVVINGCVIRNSNRRHTLTIESQRADVVRGTDLLDPEDAATPVSRVYFLIQTALIRSDLREKLLPTIREQLAVLATVFGPGHVAHIFKAANHVSQADFYRALSELRPVLAHEKILLATSARRAAAAREAHLATGT
ncbi:flagellar biosynthesis repressor FlbT [Roseibacterium sp. SDUM158017]|uniref:flagellar biosynthesis repressor FlbT n=1 Tax=Roseicyclus salinarum TaxID=3036773 RepID=UPI00241542A7|nr:flagellar biosynthesis repressor FlbT [Roseibacterium sp. SDUM158017]MDG4648640.1 flagellar biosynthesis repressor FlbT [Roseibacterium sp. SDUM158017]